MPRLRIVLAVFVLSLMSVALFNLFASSRSQRDVRPLSYSAFLEEVQKDAVRQVGLRGNQVFGTLKNGSLFSTTIARIDPTVELLLAKKVAVTVAPANEDDLGAIGVLVSWVPLLVLAIILWVFVGRPLARIDGRLRRLEAVLPPPQPGE
jgi:cell division protease FtsH